jgi:GAF domain-containing protein
MAENLIVADGSKEEKYELLYKQIAAVTDAESDTIANMANIAAMIHQTFNFWWTGFYRVIGEELVLGPFQGPLACSRIAFGRGVCGTAWREQTTQIVPDVEQFPGHIACSSLSRSEIVVPVWDGDKIVAVLDIDSEQLATFDEMDQIWLERIVELLYK